MRGINPRTRRESHAPASERKRKPLPADNSRGPGSVNKHTSLPLFFLPRILSDVSRTTEKTRGRGRARGACVRSGRACGQVASARDVCASLPIVRTYQVDDTIDGDGGCTVNVNPARLTTPSGCRHQEGRRSVSRASTHQWFR